MTTRETATEHGLPIHWIEAPEGDGLTREYYEGSVQQEGQAARGEIPRERRVLLTITKDGAGSPQSYDLTEYRIELDTVHRLLGTATSSGGLTISAPATQVGWGDAVVYTLAGGTPAAPARVFTRLHDRLYIPAHAADPTSFDLSGPSLKYIAQASRGRVELSDQLLTYPHWRTRLRVGDTLVARLTPAAGNTWSLLGESTGDGLRPENVTTAGDHQLIAFKATAPGETELVFQHVDAKDRATEYCCPLKARVRVD